MEELAKKINEEIINSSLYKSYLRLKSKVESEERLVSLKNELDCLKKNICKSKDEMLVDEYYKKEEEYLNNIVVREYLATKAELGALLKDIVDILSLN